MDDDQHQQESEATVDEPKGKRKKRDVVRGVHAELTLFVDDAELIRRLGVPEKIARRAIYVLEGRRDSGFPQKQALWGNRRYWPAVRACSIGSMARAVDGLTSINRPVAPRARGFPRHLLTFGCQRFFPGPNCAERSGVKTRDR